MTFNITNKLQVQINDLTCISCIIFFLNNLTNVLTYSFCCGQKNEARSACTDPHFMYKDTPVFAEMWPHCVSVLPLCEDNVGLLWSSRC